MKIVSWNVNGLRACAKKGFLSWLETAGAEIVALQEVRARREQLPKEFQQLEDWFSDIVSAERGGYSGVGVFSRAEPDRIETSLGVPEFDVEGRCQFLQYGQLLIVNSYFPNGNGKERDNSRVPFKLDYYRRLFDMLEERRQAGEPILVMGDFNTAHREIDLARPKQNRETSGFLPVECEELDRWIRSGWTDTFRHYCSEAGRYSWWSFRSGARAKNVGWRLDYVLASEGAMRFVKDAFIWKDVLGSDHCPVGVEVDEAILG